MVSRFQAAARILEYRGPINRGLKEKQRNQEKSILGENICIHKCYATNTHTHTKQKWRTKRIKRKWKWKRKTCQGFGPISWLLVINALSAASSNLLFPFPRTQNLVLFVKKVLSLLLFEIVSKVKEEREKKGNNGRGEAKIWWSVASREALCEWWCFWYACYLCHPTHWYDQGNILENDVCIHRYHVVFVCEWICFKIFV